MGGIAGLGLTLGRAAVSVSCGVLLRGKELDVFGERGPGELLGLGRELGGVSGEGEVFEAPRLIDELLSLGSGLQFGPTATLEGAKEPRLKSGVGEGIVATVAVERTFRRLLTLGFGEVLGAAAMVERTFRRLLTLGFGEALGAAAMVERTFRRLLTLGFGSGVCTPGNKSVPAAFLMFRELLGNEPKPAEFPKLAEGGDKEKVGSGSGVGAVEADPGNESVPAAFLMFRELSGNEPDPAEFPKLAGGGDEEKVGEDSGVGAVKADPGEVATVGLEEGERVEFTPGDVVGLGFVGSPEVGEGVTSEPSRVGSIGLDWGDDWGDGTSKAV